MSDSMEFFDPLAHEGFGWTSDEAHPDGVSEMLLHDDGDFRTRLLRFEPGVETDAVLTHDFYEEVYIISGGLVDTRLDEAFTAGMYAYREPGMEHGPYRAPVGCQTIEFRYYR
jgi:anti-sigma factor ChrR (cupin superfamily)